MFIIKWRNRATNCISPVIIGLHEFSTREAAQTQADAWKFIWPNNDYYVEPIPIKVEKDESWREWWPICDGTKSCNCPMH